MKRLSYLILPLLLTLSGCGDLEWLPDKAKPQQFSFAKQQDVELSRTVTSEEITITGNEAAAEIWVENGEYAIGGEGGDGIFTSKRGKISAGQTVKVRHTSAASNESSVSTVLNIQGVKATFTSVTKSLSADSTGTLLLTAAPQFEPGPSDAETVTGDLSVELQNISTSTSYLAEVDFVAKDSAGAVVYSGSVQSPLPLEAGETSSFVAPVSFSVTVYTRIVKWQLTAIRRVAATGS